jgi:hypothetical protein
MFVLGISSKMPSVAVVDVTRNTCCKMDNRNVNVTMYLIRLNIPTMAILDETLPPLISYGVKGN